MAKIHYKIVEHDGGWAYKLGDVFSEAFPDRAAALAAAKRVAAEQHVPGPAGPLPHAAQLPLSQRLVTSKFSENGE